MKCLVGSGHKSEKGLKGQVGRRIGWATFSLRSPVIFPTTLPLQLSAISRSRPERIGHEGICNEFSSKVQTTRVSREGKRRHFGDAGELARNRSEHLYLESLPRLPGGTNCRNPRVEFCHCRSCTRWRQCDSLSKSSCCARRRSSTRHGNKAASGRYATRSGAPSPFWGLEQTKWIGGGSLRSCRPTLQSGGIRDLRHGRGPVLVTNPPCRLRLSSVSGYAAFRPLDS